MKIKITTELPVAADVRPEVGSVHEVVKCEDRGARSGGRLYFIKVGDAQVGVFARECEIVGEEAADNG